MRAGGAKNKGNNFENAISKQLSLWITEGKREDVLIRSQNSGGRATMLSYSGRNFMSQAGDIAPASIEGTKFTDLYIVECKHYADLVLESLFFKTNKSGITEHWEKLLKECETYNKLPLYIAKQNRRPTLVCTNSKGLEVLKLENYSDIYISSIDLHCLHLTTFLKYASIENVSVNTKKQMVFKPR